MGICQREADAAPWRAGLAFLMSWCLHLRDQRFQTMMGFVDLTRQIREVSVQVHFCTGKPSVATIAAHLRAVPSHCVSVRSTSSVASCEGSAVADGARYAGGQTGPSPSIC